MSVRVSLAGGEVLSATSHAWTGVRIALAGGDVLSETTYAYTGVRVALAGAEVLSDTLHTYTGVRVALAGLDVLSQAPAPSGSMSTQIFPTLPGLGWSLHKQPNWSTRVATHQGGREIRAASQQYPVWDFELTFEVLPSGGAYQGAGTDGFQTLMDFYLARQGQFDTFLFQDPSDCAVVEGQIGVADGVTTTFTLTRSFAGGFAEPVGYVFGGGLSAVYVGGSAVSSSLYTFTPPNTLTFATAPASGAGVIAASFNFYFSVRFAKDMNDFEQFMANLWQVKTLKLRSVLA